GESIDNLGAKLRGKCATFSRIRTIVRSRSTIIIYLGTINPPCYFSENAEERSGASHFCSQSRNLSFEGVGRRKEEEGRSQKKCFYQYEMLPIDRPF
ncbi:hypothetical protein, partial [Microcoleus sp. MON2_D6]|uniref:hypothetical protein n=2 Tax=Microcoleus TaxID=44471 RepID=UPI002FD36D1C